MKLADAMRERRERELQAAIEEAGQETQKEIDARRYAAGLSDLLAIIWRLFLFAGTIAGIVALARSC